MFTKDQSGELALVTSSNIPSPLKWFLGPFSDFASSLYLDEATSGMGVCEQSVGNGTRLTLLLGIPSLIM